MTYSRRQNCVVQVLVIKCRHLELKIPAKTTLAHDLITQVSSHHKAASSDLYNEAANPLLHFNGILIIITDLLIFKIILKNSSLI